MLLYEISGFNLLPSMLKKLLLKKQLIFVSIEDEKTTIDGKTVDLFQDGNPWSSVYVNGKLIGISELPDAVILHVEVNQQHRTSEQEHLLHRAAFSELVELKKTQHEGVWALSNK